MHQQGALRDWLAPFVTLVVVTLLAAALAGPSANAHTGFYGQRWKKDKSVAWRFTPSAKLGSQWTARVTDGQRRWNSLSQTMKFVPDGSMANFNGKVCPSTYQKNAVHVASLDGKNGALGIAFTCFSGSELFSFNIIFDSGETWYTGTGTPPSTKADLLAVAVHEFGHATGLGIGVNPSHFDPNASICNVTSSIETMCPFAISGTTWGRSLGTHDKHTFTGAY
jgi:Matrixin